MGVWTEPWESDFERSLGAALNANPIFLDITIPGYDPPPINPAMLEAPMPQEVFEYFQKHIKPFLHGSADDPDDSHADPA